MNVIGRRATRSTSATQTFIPLLRFEARKHVLRAVPWVSFSNFTRKRASFPGGPSQGMMMNMNVPPEKGAALKQYVTFSSDVASLGIIIYGFFDSLLI